MSTDIKLRVTEIQRFCMHDGPGVRTTVFLKGCPLRCAWCHNPETQKAHEELLFYPSRCILCGACVVACPNMVHRIEEQHIVERDRCVRCAICASVCPSKALEMCGKELSINDILAVVEKDRAFYGEMGGITLSGGEPFAQKNAVALLKAGKERGLLTAVETCGYCDPNILIAAIPFVDLFLWDIKDTNDERHRQYTSVSNKLILSNLNLASEMNARIRLRCILVNGVNTDETHYRGIAELASGLINFDGVELIPYHAYGGTKSIFIGDEDNGRREWIPEKTHIEQAYRVLKDYDIPVIHS